MPCERRDAVKQRKKMPRERLKHGKQYATWSANPDDPRPGDASEVPTSEDDPQYAILTKEFHPGDPTIPSGATITEETSLDIKWNRDVGWVQMCMVVPREKWMSMVDEVKEHENAQSLSVYVDTLSRHEINTMIKTLRRARDAAFGADE
jgi:hypothetical protein